MIAAAAKVAAAAEAAAFAAIPPATRPAVAEVDAKAVAAEAAAGVMKMTGVDPRAARKKASRASRSEAVAAKRVAPGLIGAPRISRKLNT
jgi:hypothetical protein